MSKFEEMDHIHARGLSSLMIRLDRCRHDGQDLGFAKPAFRSGQTGSLGLISQNRHQASHLLRFG